MYQSGCSLIHGLSQPVWLGHPVDDTLHTLLVDILEHRLKLIHWFQSAGLHRNNFQRHKASLAPLFFFNAYRVDWHKPKNIHAHFLEARNVPVKAHKGAFFSIIPEVYLIDIGVLVPIRNAGLGPVRSLGFGSWSISSGFFSLQDMSEILTSSAMIIKRIMVNLFIVVVLKKMCQ